ncbi:MAG: hypothetical protein WCS55_03305 [Sulfuricurvum sp.]|uniref:hypothetical protein n=1 Tax=Sulfuricurvum sp. TaxID=2025608 RepID=UPI003565A60D
MPYNYYLQFDDKWSVHENVHSNSLHILAQDYLEINDFPFVLVYQNNQDRNVALATNQPLDEQNNERKWLFSVEDVISFTWKNGSHEIFYFFHESATNEIFKFWLYHIVLPIKLSIEQVYKFLHAGAVEVEGHPILFMAPSFGGKSTLTDYFIQMGHPLITDDKMATFEKNGIFYSVPSHPYHRPYRQVEVLGYECENSATKIKPIHAIYILEKGGQEDECTIRPLKGIEKFSRLHEGGEMNFSFFTKDYVQYLSRLANNVNVFSIKVPHDLARLHEVYGTIVEHCESIKSE